MEYNIFMSSVVPVAGGKGGVGKSIISLNLAIALTQRGSKVVLCDLDLGGSNLHTMLGLKNNHAGIGQFILKKEKDLQPLLQETGIPGLQFIAGDSLCPGVANMDFFSKQRIIRELQRLDADFVIADLGAGSAYNITDFFLMVPNGIAVVTPEITSILNAYSFLKSAIFRFCYRQYPPKSPERTILQNYILQRIEGKEYSFFQILSIIDNYYPGSGTRVLEALKKFNPRIIMNMGRQQSDVEMANRLGRLVCNRLSVQVSYLGFVPYDNSVPVSVANRKPIAVLYPDSVFYSVFADIAASVSAVRTAPLSLEDANEEFSDIVKKFYDRQG